MADYERNSRNDRERHQGRGRDNNRFQDERLDDRTGYGPGSAGGYSAEQGASRGQGYGQRNYGDFGRDDSSGATYGGYEDRSFTEEAAQDGGFYGAASGGQDAYGGRPSGSAREYQTNAGAWDRSRGYGASQSNRGGYSQGGGGRDRQSQDFSPYQNYDRGASSGGGFGQELNQGRSYDMNRDRHQGRDDHRGFLDKASDRVSSMFGDDAARERLRGDHAGRGPKGYKRSDDRIRDDVSDRLADDSWLDASDIEVVVAEAEVTLAGTVQDRDAKRRAESLAESISGVTHVQNNLRVSQANRGASDNRSNSDQAQVSIDTSNGHNSALTKQASGRA